MKPSRWGVLMVFAGAALQFAGAVSLGLFAATLGFIVAVAGIATAAGGFPWLRTLAFPLCLLLFMLPKPEFAWSSITGPLQLLAGRLAVFLVTCAGIAVHRDGNVLEVAGHRLAVEEACSGLRYVLSLGFLSLVWARLSGLRGRRLAAAGLAALPAALLINGLRVAAIAAVCSFNAPLALGSFHDVSGWLVLLPALIIEWLLLRALRQPAGIVPVPGLQIPTKAPAPFSCIALVIAILIIQIVPVRLGPSLERPPQLTTLSALPANLAGWRFTREALLPPEEMAALNTDDFLRRYYAGPQANSDIELRVAYYRSQRVHGRMPHSPRVCLPANGWSMVQSRLVNISGNEVNVYEAEKNGQRALVMYWYQTPWQITANEWTTRAWVTFNGLIHRRTDVALVTLVAPVNATDHGQSNAFAFVPRAAAAIRDYLQ
jgi:EpsI family protein